jgi:hypothetical protein
MQKAQRLKKLPPLLLIVLILREFHRYPDMQRTHIVYDVVQRVTRNYFKAWRLNEVSIVDRLPIEADHFENSRSELAS